MTLAIVNRTLPDWGTLYKPSGNGPFPAILLLHGSEGGWAGWMDCEAAILAAHGFLALPLRYSSGGNPWNAGNIRDVALDRTVAALVALRGAAECNGKVGIYGASRGAEHALLLTSLMARDGVAPLPDALAAHAPSDVVCGAFVGARWRDEGDPGWQVWDPADRAWTWRGSSDGLLPTTPIEIERYDGPLFLSAGTADEVWSAEMMRRLATRYAQNRRAPEVHAYQGQGHILDSEAENQHRAALIGFFRNHLG